MSFTRSYPVTLKQIVTAFEVLKFEKEQYLVHRPFTLPQDLVQIEVDGRDEIETFMLTLACIVSGDALAGEVSKLPTVVDAQDLFDIMAEFRSRLEEMEDQDEHFVLTLEFIE